MKKNLFILLTFAFALGSACATETCAGLEAGAKAYNEGDFERAVDEWRSCADSGINDADLFYNLGNAYFRSGKLGFSIFYYKKALRLRANDSDIQHNLKYAQAMTRDKVDEDSEENPILNALFRRKPHSERPFPGAPRHFPKDAALDYARHFLGHSHCRRPNKGQPA